MVLWSDASIKQLLIVAPLLMMCTWGPSVVLDATELPTAQMGLMNAIVTGLDAMILSIVLMELMKPAVTGRIMCFALQRHTQMASTNCFATETAHV
jgi:hypothetical protein